MRTALIIGATGLVGSAFLQLILEDTTFDVVKIFVRKDTGIRHPKLKEWRVNFNQIDQWKHLIIGTDFFSCMGTTIKQAGSKQAQFVVDYTYQYECAVAASENGVNNYYLISSGGANSKSPIFYSRIKGELEDAISALPFQKIFILQPSLLVGEREVKRTGEAIGEYLLAIANAIGLFIKYQPIKATTVAKALLKLANKTTDARKISTYAYGTIKDL